MWTWVVDGGVGADGGGGESGSPVSHSIHYLYLGKVEKYCPGALCGLGVWDAHFWKHPLGQSLFIF